MGGKIVLGSFDNGAVSFELDYDDNRNAHTFRCVNNSEHPAFGSISSCIEPSVVFELLGEPLAVTTADITCIAVGSLESEDARGYCELLRYPANL